jgi:hypothetical protein
MRLKYLYQEDKRVLRQKEGPYFLIGIDSTSKDTRKREGVGS